MALKLGSITGTVVSGGTYDAFPGICQLPSGRLLCAYLVLTNHLDPNGIIATRTSVDQGATWSSATTVYDPAGTTTGPTDVELQMLANGTVLLSGMQVTVGVADRAFTMIGTIGGGDAITWGSPVSIIPWNTVVGCSSKAIELANGDLVLPVHGRNSTESKMSAGVVKSTDHGASWDTMIPVASDPGVSDYDEAGMVLLANGTLVMIIRRDLTGSNAYLRSTSTNGGVTWSAATVVINIGAAYPGRPTLLLLSNGELFLLTRQKFPITTGYSFSADNGLTWTAFNAWGTNDTGQPLGFVYASATRLQSGKVGAVIARENSSTLCNITYQEFTTASLTELAAKFISFWELEEASGTRIDAITASANDLTDNNTVTQTTGKVGSAASFASASSESLTRADNASLSMGNIDFFWCGWVKFTTLSGTRIIVHKGDGNVGGSLTEYELGWSDAISPPDRLYFAAGNGVSASGLDLATTFGALSTGVWYFVYAEYDPTADMLGISVNAGPMDIIFYEYGSHNSTFGFSMGRWTNFAGGFLDGALDQIGFGKARLTQSEITWLYNAGAGRTYAAILAAGDIETRTIAMSMVG